MAEVKCFPPGEHHEEDGEALQKEKGRFDEEAGPARRSRGLWLAALALPGPRAATQTASGKFWVFYGALSNVEYTLTVTDTQTGAVKTYKNLSGQFASVADTEAF